MTDGLATEAIAEAPETGAPAALSEAAPGAPASEDPAGGAGEFAEDAVVADPNAAGSRTGLFAFAAALSAASLFGLLSASGIWEPHELNVADFARRIAVALFGASRLAVESGVNTVPTASELGRGELPFTSVALSLRLFGLSEWAGRLPMALWGAIGILATVLLLSKLVDRVAGAFAAIVLATTPLYFLHSRTILGDVVTFAAVAVAVAGLGVATFDARPSAARRLGYFLLGAAGLAAGFGARGALIGIAIPSLSVAFTRLVKRSSAPPDRLGDVFGFLCLALGAAASVLAVRVLLGAELHQFSRILGGTVDNRRGTLTHDALVLQLGHGMLPWSALAPFALGLLLRPPPGAPGEASERESSARLLVAVVCVVAFAVHGALTLSLGALPFAGVCALAAAIAIALRDFERGAPISRTLILGVASFLVLFYTDFKNFPEKGLSAFVVTDPKFPESFKKQADLILKLGTVGSAGLFALFAYEREEMQRAFDRDEYRKWPHALRTAFEGNLWFGAIAVEAVLVVTSILSFVSERGPHWAPFESMVGPARDAARYGFLAVPVVLALPSLALFARDATRVTVRALRVSRGTAALLSIAAFGAALSFVYYPTLARQISPKEVFEAYRRWSKNGEELGMLGGSSGSARYYAKRDVRTFATSQEAFGWLTEGMGRKWLVVRAGDLGQMNSQYRALRTPAKNLPVLDARSSEILLVSNRLGPGEANENPLSKWVLESRPAPTRKLDIDFNGQLRGLGWDVTDPDGKPVQKVHAGKPYTFRLYYEVVRAISGEWQTFIHVDGYQRRYNGDHDTLEGKYPFHLWRPGDYIVDVHPFELEPNFTAGTYTMFFGLFRGDQRLAVKRGGGDDNRVNAGPLEVF